MPLLTSDDMKKYDIFDIILRLLLFAVGITCLVMVFAGGLLRDREQPPASQGRQPEATPTPEPDIDTLAVECDSVAEDGYGTFYYHPGQDPEWTTEK